MVKLFQAFVRLSEEGYVSKEVELSQKRSVFNGCIGAIDGTLVRAHIPQKHQRNWRSRKGMVHQNVFAAVHAGFGRQEGIIQPYYGIRYHLQEWREGNRGPETAEELYNLRQSGSRIIVEQVIGMIKRKWKILRETAPEYGLRTQMRIVYAVCGLHNFIRRDGEEEVDEEADLPRWQRDQLEQARQRCERLEGMLPPEIREQIVRASWTAYLEEKRRRERRVD
ncbi:uncharacterized protein PG998_014495 [Apiospora kogelbergensis]|uniref:uncharacterized protein n=1 Tax=Apiospora kogelbergensis TaxID=1337665 RepID=UPI00312F51C4